MKTNTARRTRGPNVKVQTFEGWAFAHDGQTLIDQDGNAYSPGMIRAGCFLLGCFDVRNRLLFADDGIPRRLLETSDMT